MKLSHRIENSICILSVEGQLMEDGISETRTYTQPLFEDELIKGVVLNLLQMKYIDSSGFGWLISAFKTLKSHNASMVICHLNAQMKETFKMVRIDNVIRILPNEEEALNEIMK